MVHPYLLMQRNELNKLLEHLLRHLLLSLYRQQNNLRDNDHRCINKPKGINSDIKISYDECMSIISMLRFNEESDIFAIERNRGLESIINNI